MIQRLRIKFVCMVMAIVMLMLGGILGVVIWFTSENMEMQSISMMRAIAANPFQQGYPGQISDGIRLPYFAVQIGIRGDMTAMGGGYFDLTDQNAIQEIVNAALTADRDIGKLEGYDLRFLITSNPMGFTIVFADTSTEAATLHNMIMVCIGIFFAASAVFLGISILLSHWAVKPVAVAWEQQRQFVADASHELKTPLSVIMANAELLENEENREDVKHFSQNILSVSYQMRGLVENMLEMARVDNGSLKMTFEPLDLSQLVNDAVLSFGLLYEEQAMALESHIEEDITIQGSEQHLYQVLDVLLDNALKYATPNGTVTVRLTQHNRGCILSVASPGEPLSKEDRKRIFERFYRADKARAMNGSYGLGLSIAKSIVEAHKGKIWVDSRENENIFSVQLPI